MSGGHAGSLYEERGHPSGQWSEVILRNCQWQDGKASGHRWSVSYQDGRAVKG